MKTLRTTIVFGTWILFLAFGSALSAQNTQTNYDRMKDYLSDYMVLASQAQGTCQQVDAFASNGNINQLMNSAGSLSRAVSEMNLLKLEMARTPIPDRIILASVLDLVSGIDADSRIWNAAQGAAPETIANIASALRESLAHHKGQAQEIRIAICCVFD